MALKKLHTKATHLVQVMAEFADKEPAEILVDQSAEVLSESVVVPMDVPTETEQSEYIGEAKVNTEVNVVVAQAAPLLLYCYCCKAESFLRRTL